MRLVDADLAPVYLTRRLVNKSNQCQLSTLFMLLVRAIVESAVIVFISQG